MTVEAGRVDGPGGCHDPDTGPADAPPEHPVLSAQLAAVRVLSPGLELQHLKSSVRSRLFGIAGEPTKLGGHTIRRLIGRGGMGAVYEATDERGEVVALKTLHGFDPAALFRLKQEFRALTDLDHPNLVGLHHLVASGDQVFVTMESIDGRDFLAEVQAGTPLAALLPQLVAGVAALHAAGKLHRDLKPSNVLVTRAGRVVILDFGLVQECGGPRGELVGTPAYMAPELLLGAAPTPASDWYSVGVMLYEALTGRLPFRGDAVAVLHAKLAHDPAPAHAPADPALAALCEQLLARDPARRAGAREILGALGGPPAPAIVHLPRGAALVGRGDELAALRAAHAATLAGDAAIVLVRGAPGVGKTTLVQAFLAGLTGPAASGTVVLCGRCYEREQVPHNAFDSLVDALTGHLLGLSAADQAAALTGDTGALAHLFPVLRRLPLVAAAHAAASPDLASGTAVRDRAYATLRATLAWLGARAPVVLHLDDLQWADGDSLVLLAEIAAAAPRGCLLIAGVGDDGGPATVADDLQRLLTAGPLCELRLGPLAPADALVLARVLLAAHASTLPTPISGDELNSAARLLARESAGLPLFAQALAHAYRDLPLGTDARACRLETLISARTARLPPAARDLLELLAVAGRPLALTVVARLFVPGEAFRFVGHAALRQLRAARLVRTRRTDRDEWVELYHDRIREIVTAALDPRRLRDNHRLIADALAAGDHEPEELAHHLRAAGQIERARAATLAAARQAAQTLAFHRAAELLLVALDLSPMTDVAGRCALRVEAGVALASAGRGEEAANCFLAAAAAAPPMQALDLRRRAAEALIDSGAVARGLAELESVLAALGLKIPRSHAGRAVRLAAEQLRLRARGLAFTPRRNAEIDEATLVRLDALRLARLALIQHDPTTGRIYQLELLRRTLDVGEPGRIVRALAAHAAYVSHDDPAGIPEAEALLARARALGERHGLDDTGPLLALFSGMVAYNAGAWRPALAHLDAAGLPLAHVASPSIEAKARGLLVGLCGVMALGSLFFLGDLALLTRRRQVFRNLLRHLGDHPGEARLTLSWQVFAHLAADDPAAALRDLAAPTRRWPAEAFPYERAHGNLAAWAALAYAGNPTAAWFRVTADWPDFTRTWLYSNQRSRVIAHFWRGAIALQAARTTLDPRPLRAVAEAARRAITDEHVRWADPLAHVLRAGLAEHPGLAIGALTVAIAGFDAHDMQLWAAAARHQAACLSGDTRRMHAAAARITELGAQNPARMAACLVPVD